ncbi:MAG: PGF-CTERM sorting domain-containing protein [Halobacteriota archaeon]
METKKRGGTITGIALVAIMVASVMLAMVASTAAYSTGGKYNIINNSTTPPAQQVLTGQDLKFIKGTDALEWTSAPTVMQYGSNGNQEHTYPSAVGDGGDFYIDNVDWGTSGTFYVNGGATVSAAYCAQLSVSDPKIPLQLKVGDKIVTSLAKGTPGFHTDVGGRNLFPEDGVDLVIMGPNGQITTKNGQNFKGINVSTLTDYTSVNFINTTGWDVGHYTFQVKTKPENACGLDTQSTLREMNIIKAAVTITAEPTEVAELTTVKLTVTGVAGTPINVLEDTLSPHAYFPAGLNDNQGPKNNNFTDTIDSDGTRTYAVEFNDTGAYTIKVTDLNDLSGDTYDTVDITVTEKGVTFDVPSTVVIGQRFTIKGTANTGNMVTVAVDDEVVLKLNNIVIDENNEFSEEIDTSADAAPGAFKLPGSVRLKAYIDYPGGTGPVLQGITDDGSFAILMTKGELTAELSTKSVAKGDDFTIIGKAKGSKNVNILIVAPKGFSGSNIETNGKEMYYTSTSVTTTDDSFYKKITVNDDVNSGKYLVMILSAGSDDKWGKSGYDTLYNPSKPTDTNTALGQYTLSTRTQEGMLEIVKDMSALSDDLLWIGLVNVESPYVILNPIAEVNIGEPMEVTGTTNRKDGYTIVVTAKGPTELTPATVPVHNSTFNATLDTSDAKVGVYVVTADDGDGNTDTEQVSIGGAAVPAETPLTSPAAETPMPTAEAPTPAAETPMPTEEAPTPTPKPVPGFVGVFAIAGLLAVAYLLLRRRK